MNSQQLQCFIYVAERLNFTKAAETLYLSVPTVTHHIKTLEEELGTTLVYRNTRVVKLTEAGEKFYLQAKDLYNRMEDAKTQFRDYSAADQILFRIGCMSESELRKLESVMVEMRQQYPHLRPKVLVKDFYDLKSLYENQQLDIVIASQGLTIQGNFKKVCTYRSYAAMTKDNPLSTEKELTFNQIANESLITLQPKCVFYEKGNKFQEFLTLHAQDHAHLVSDGEAESILLAKSGFGIALLPGFMDAAKNETTFVPIAGTNNIGYGFYYREKEKHIQTFMNCYIRENGF